MKTSMDDNNRQPFFDKGSPVTTNFQGDVWLNMLDDGGDDLPPIGYVTFSPGSRSNWHYHDKKQILLVLAGEGVVGFEKKAPIFLKRGDIIKIDAHEKHWHGSSPDDWFAQIAIVDAPTHWGKKVNQETYNQTLENINQINR